MDRKENFLKTTKDLGVKKNEAVEGFWKGLKIHTEKRSQSEYKKLITDPFYSYTQGYQQANLKKWITNKSTKYEVRNKKN